MQKAQSAKNPKAYVIKEGTPANNHFSNSNKAVHVKKVEKDKPSGFKDRVTKAMQHKMDNDYDMKNHIRDDATLKKKNPKKLEKSMSLQVREYLANVEERVANVPAKEIGARYGYDIDDPENTL